MKFSGVSTQSPKAYDTHNLSAAQIIARVNSVADSIELATLQLPLPSTSVHIDITASETAAGVTPADYSVRPYLASRYGIVPDGATDFTTQLNNAIAACVQAGAALVFDLPGVILHGRLTAFSGDLVMIGYGRTTTLKVLGGGSWPFASTSNTSLMQSAHKVTIEGLAFDMDWTFATHGGAKGSWNDGVDPTTWGGFFYGTFTGTAVTIRGCHFANATRMFLLSGVTDAQFTNNVADCALCDGQGLFVTSGCTNVRKSDNYLSYAKWTDYDPSTHVYTGLSPFLSWGDVDVQICNNILIGVQSIVNGNTNVGMRCVFTGNILDTPVADTSFQHFSRLICTNNHISMSGDMGISTDFGDYVLIANNVIESVMAGCILTSGKNCVVIGNVCKDWMQGYTLINTLGGRYCSTAGQWGSAISTGFQSGEPGSQNLIIQGNTCSMPNLPPVSDIHGPIRAFTNGIYVQTTPSSAHQTVICSGNFVDVAYADLPGCFVFCPTVISFITTKTGTPIPGEKFVDTANNSFIYMNDSGGGGGDLQMRSLHAVTYGGAPLNTSAVFTGALSGAVLTLNPSGGVNFWLRARSFGNIDWTETADFQANG